MYHNSITFVIKENYTNHTDKHRLEGLSEERYKAGTDMFAEYRVFTGLTGARVFVLFDWPSFPTSPGLGG